MTRWLWNASIALGLCLSSAAMAAQPEKIDPAATLQAMEKVADWQLANLLPPPSIKSFREESTRPRSWEQGAFYVGLTQLAERSKSPRFREAILAHGRQEQWQPGDRNITPTITRSGKATSGRTPTGPGRKRSRL